MTKRHSSSENHKQHKTLFRYTMVYSKRKSIAISMDKKGNIRVMAPNKCPEHVVLQFVEQKEDWVMKHLNHQKLTPKRQLSFNENAQWELLGKCYSLKKDQVAFKRDEKVVIDDTLNSIHMFSADFNEMALFHLMERELKKIAGDTIKNRMEQMSAATGLIPKQVSVKSQKSRWGSCTSRGHILLNWRLIFAPLFVMDYVIVHELCHLKHLDHSKNFWQAVACIDPEYKEKQEWLKTHALLLEWDAELIQRSEENSVKKS